MVNLDSSAPPLTPISISISSLKPLLTQTKTHTETKPDSYLLSGGDRYWISCFSGTVCVCACACVCVRVCLSRSFGEFVCTYVCFCLITSVCVRICTCMNTFVCLPLSIHIHSCSEFSPHIFVCVCVFVCLWVRVHLWTIGVCGYELSLISRRPVLAKQTWHSAAPTSYLSLGIRH